MTGIIFLKVIECSQVKGRDEITMIKQKVNYYHVRGTHEEIGRQLAKIIEPKSLVVPAPDFFTDKEVKEAMALYEQYCPGMMEEVRAFAEAGDVDVKDLACTWMTYLVPRCSGMAVLGSKMSDGRIRLARNYEFGIEEEDMTLCQIHAKGQYAHIGGTTVVFGREEGINECGLAVAMSSCGMPVSNIVGMKAPKVKGLQFWAVVRSLLDNCQDVEEALRWLQNMPIAFNINLYLADAKGNAALVETMDGHMGYQKLSETSEKKYVCGTNHIVLSELQSYEPVAMRNSIVRYNQLEQFLSGPNRISEDEIKELLLKKYPEGMSCYFYKDWFGTIKSIVMDPIQKRLSICWLGQKENGWEDYFVTKEMQSKTEDKLMTMEEADYKLFEFIPIV